MQRQQSWLSRHAFIHRLVNAAIVLFCVWVVGSVAIGMIRAG